MALHFSSSGLCEVMRGELKPHTHAAPTGSGRYVKLVLDGWRAADRPKLGSRSEGFGASLPRCKLRGALHVDGHTVRLRALLRARLLTYRHVVMATTAALTATSIPNTTSNTFVARSVQLCCGGTRKTLDTVNQIGLSKQKMTGLKMTTAS